MTIFRAALTETGAHAHRPTAPAAALAIDELVVQYRQRSQWQTAVSDVSLALDPGDYLGVVGESGCGKSTLIHALLGLLPANARVSAGAVRIDGHDVVGLRDKEFRPLRWNTVAVVLQSGMNALNPLLTLRAQFRDLFKAHGLARRDADRRCEELLTRVRVPADRADAYAHQLSGGMRQRACIALALALDPKLLILDEPTTALDVVVQREIFDLIDELKAERGFAVLLVSHDLALVLERASRVAVMYAGRIVELAPGDALEGSVKHPYAAGLLAAFPRLGQRSRAAEIIPGAPPRLGSFPAGCAFHPRCVNRQERCSLEEPPLEQRGAVQLACFYPVGAEAAGGEEDA